MTFTDTVAAGQREPVKSAKVKKQKAVVYVESFQNPCSERITKCTHPKDLITKGHRPGPSRTGGSHIPYTSRLVNI